MTVKSVRFGLTTNLGNYQSERLDVEVELEDGDTPESVLEDLRLWVAKHSLDPEEAIRMVDQKLKSAREMHREMETLQADLLTARDQWLKVQAFLTKAGLSIPESYQNEIPF